MFHPRSRNSGIVLVLVVVLVPTPPSLRRGQSCWRRTDLSQSDRARRSVAKEASIYGASAPRKEPIFLAIILFRLCDGEILEFSRTATSNLEKALFLSEE